VNSFDDVKVFMDAADQNEKGFGEQSKLYMKLIEEEFEELLLAYSFGDLVEIADACADLKWVIEGLEQTLDIPAQEVWFEVSRSNLSKISDNGKIIKREDGKVLKPDTYSPPDIRKVFEKCNKNI
jgi:predicted HAD superfamily Cof-like phosphohydrolase